MKRIDKGRPKGLKIRFASKKLTRKLIKIYQNKKTHAACCVSPDVFVCTCPYREKVGEGLLRFISPEHGDLLIEHVNNHL